MYVFDVTNNIMKLLINQHHANLVKNGVSNNIFSQHLYS